MNNQAFLLLLSGALCFLFVSPLQAQTLSNIDEFRKAALLRRTFGEEIIPSSSSRSDSEKRVSQDRIKNFVEAVQKQPRITDGGVAKLLLTQSRSLFSFRASEVTQWFQNAFDTANTIESLELIRNAYKNIGVINQSGLEDDLFPIKRYCELEFTAKIKWGRWPYPSQENHTKAPLSLTFSRLGLYDLAWRVQMEEGKKYYDTPNPYGNYHSFYLRAADNTYRAGNKELAWSFLMNAAVFDAEEFFEPAMEMAQLWLDIDAGKARLPQAEIAQGIERKELFLEIVKRYQAMNAHPRAWLFIKEYRNEFDKPDELIKQVQDDWLELVKMITNPRIANKIVMYGVQLYPDGADPLSVSIPWPFPEGGLEKLKARLGDAAEKAKIDEKDGFRTWYYLIEGEKTTRAKYISCVNDVVTLEKTDGRKMTIGFSKLIELDQNYVRRRLELE